MNLTRISFLPILFLFSIAAHGQESQLLYLKILPSGGGLSSIGQGSVFVISVSEELPFDASIWPDSDPYTISPELSRSIVIYDSNLNPIGDFQLDAFHSPSPILRNGNTVVFQVKSDNGQLYPFHSSPELTGDYPPFIYGANYILTYDLENQKLKMPFNCQCPGLMGIQEHSYPVSHYEIVTNVVSVGGARGIATSDGRIITTLKQLDDILINWEDEFPIGENYWNTLWLKIDPISGDYIATPMLSHKGTALTASLFASETDNAIFRSGIVRGNGVPMSPDGTVWYTNQTDSMYYAFFLKENENGDQDWMKTLYSYNNTNSDTDPGGAILNLRHFITSKVELNGNIFLSESYKFSLREGDTLLLNDFFGNQEEYTLPSGYNPGTSNFIAKSAHIIYKFSSNGVPIGSLSLPLRNPSNFTYENVWYQTPFLTKSGNKLGWINQYKANQDTTIYFIRNSLNMNIDSVGVDLPAGAGVFITWMDSYFNIITTTNIPFSPGSNPNNSGLTLFSASIYHGDTLLLAGNIDGGTTTSLDPSGIADDIFYENSTRFLAFCTLPDIINSIPEIDNNESIQAFTVFPNPGKSTFIIRGNQEDVLESWSVFDLSGRLVSQDKNGQYASENRVRLNVTPGVYFLSLKTKTGSTESHKIVVGD